MIFKNSWPKFKVSIDTLLEEFKPLELEKYEIWQTSINCSSRHFGFPRNQNLDAFKKSKKVTRGPFYVKEAIKYRFDGKSQADSFRK